MATPLVDERRVRALNGKSVSDGPIIYWMSRDQRVADNWALLHAAELARTQEQPLLVVFALAPSFLGATARQYRFMFAGLREVEQRLRELGISFVLLEGDPGETVPAFAERVHAGAVVTDFDPLRIKRQWKEAVTQKLACTFAEVDAHNIVPCWVASPKQEYGAYTLRPKLRKLLGAFLTPFPDIARHVPAVQWKDAPDATDWDVLKARFVVDETVPAVDWITPGERAAHEALTDFVTSRLPRYDQDRNDPNLDGQSNLSPYLHFGQLAPQRVALAVTAAAASDGAKRAFLDELITWRELADNFCFYNRSYDAPEGLPTWARDSLAAHAADEREYTYTRAQLEHSQTHDDLWNAAQRQMVQKGKLHGYLRMYWGKKILEWSPSISEAVATAIHLNDRYELDGRDPNGYAGIAWALGGLHDRPWFERAVYGKIRYMNYNGAKKKFDVARYVASVG